MQIRTVVALALLIIGLGIFFFIAGLMSPTVANVHQMSTDEGLASLVSPHLPAVEFVSGIGGVIETVVVSGNTAYVGEGAGLTILDVSDTSSPSQQTHLPLPDLVENMQLVDDLLYVANLYSGLQIIDVSNRSEPILLGGYDTPGVAIDILIADQRAYIADGNRGLQIVDVSNPAAPEILGSYEAGEYISSIQVIANKAFLSDPNNGLYILDVEQLDQPVLLKHISELRALDAQILDNFGYFVGGELELSIFDLTDPLNPVLVGSCSNSVESAHKLQVINDIAYVTTYGTFVTIDVGNPSMPTKLDDLTLGRPTNLYVNDNMGYVADDNGSVEIIDVSNPNAIEKEGQYRAQRLANAIEIKDNFAYVADSRKGFQVIDISDTAKPVWIVRDDYPSGATDIALKGEVAYVAKEERGLQIFDVSTPFSPTVIGNYPYSVSEIELGDDLAYVVGGGEFQILDLSDPTSPTLRATYSGIRSISVSRNLVFGIDQEGFQIIDSINPDNPHFVGRYSLSDTIPGKPNAIAVKNNSVYLTVGPIGLQVVDVSNPVEPILSRTLSRYNGTVKVVGDYLYIAGGTGLKKLGVLEVSSQYTLKPRASYSLPAQFNDIEIFNDLAYVADSSGGVQILRIHFDGFPPDVYLPLIMR